MLMAPWPCMGTLCDVGPEWLYPGPVPWPLPDILMEVVGSVLWAVCCMDTWFGPARKGRRGSIRHQRPGFHLKVKTSEFPAGDFEEEGSPQVSNT